MIKSLTIAGRVQLCDPLVSGPVRELNFVFRPNGSGKTSIGRALADHSYGTGVEIEGSRAASTELIRVYNRDYIADTFDRHKSPSASDHVRNLLRVDIYEQGAVAG
ncbi:hypothetical protein [Demequina sp.]|uniref:hypothetical protein n=1 Tax=Demequina sp. TaxID=2050685 RepID=UPI003D0BA6A1